MTDLIDRACEVQLNANEAAIKQHLNRIQITSKYCIDCGIKINSARAAIVSACRCIDCQTCYERGNR